MKLRQYILRMGLSWAALAAFMMFLQPSKLPVVVLIVPFLLLFAVFYTTWNLLHAVWWRFFAQQPQKRPSRRLGLAVCVSAVLLMVLQSLGQLSLRDVVTVVAIVTLGYIYLARSLSSSPKA
jgi:hypothetical protein